MTFSIQVDPAREGRGVSGRVPYYSSRGVSSRYGTHKGDPTALPLHFRVLPGGQAKEFFFPWVAGHGLQTANHVICIRVWEGTVNQCVVYPREVFRHALIAGASAVILIHNHPSGVTKPSDANVRLTRTIADAGKVFDIMIHDTHYYRRGSFLQLSGRGNHAQLLT